MQPGTWVAYAQTASTNVTLHGEWTVGLQQAHAAEAYRLEQLARHRWYQRANLNFYTQESAADYPPAPGLNYGFGDFHVENMPADIRLPQRPQVVTITKEAIEKARTLLLSCLSDAQRRQFEAQGYFEVVAASGTRYRITKGWGGNVLSIHNNRPRDRFCIHPSLYVPEEDNMLAQKLLLEHDEGTFLRTANRSAA